MGEISRSALACGATLVAETIPGLRSVAVCWLVPGGSADDPADRLGRSAVWSEMLMRGAGGLDSRAQADAFDRLGCARAVEVGTYFMRFTATVLADRLDDALPLIADMAVRPALGEDQVGPAKELALQSLESLKDDPSQRAGIAARARHHRAPRDRSGLGTVEGIEALTHGELTAGWRAAARPGRSIIALAGAVEGEAAARALDRLLTGWEGSSPEPTQGPEAPRGYGHEEDATNQVQIIAVSDAPPEGHGDSVLEKIVCGVLSGGMSGRLFSEVREKRGLCYAVSAGYRGDRDLGEFSAYVGTTPERAQESLDVLAGELARLGTPGGRMTPEEFTRAVVGMKSRLVFSGESSGARAAAAAVDVHRLGRARTLREMAEEVDRVTLDRVNEYLERRRPGRWTVQTLGPSPLNPPATLAP
ncbi:MAG: insulinase family protein [Phycisphaeraceae bacterium]|nr:MAG: insulinase family protein [Phycisphaeraceae bacterium]